jgi:hypothetical protein
MAGNSSIYPFIIFFVRFDYGKAFYIVKYFNFGTNSLRWRS